MDFPVAQTVKRLPTMQETQVQSLGQEDLLEKETATYSSILAWKIPWMEEPGRATVHGVAKSWTRLSDFTFLLSFMIWSTLSLKKKNWSASEVAQTCPTLCNHMDCNLPRLLHPWNFPGKNTGVGCHFLFQGIFPTQGSNPGLPHCRQMLYQLTHGEAPKKKTKNLNQSQKFKNQINIRRNLVSNFFWKTDMCGSR